MFRSGRIVTTNVFVTVCAAIAFVAFAIPPAANAQPPPGRFLVSLSNVILECNVDGTACFNVTRSGGDPNPSTATQASIAANGTIAFNDRFSPDGTCVPGSQGICWFHIFAMNADGTNVRQLTFTNGQGGTQGDLGPSISPDSSKVAFFSNRDPVNDGNGNPNYLYQIYSVNIDGTGLHQITFPVFGQPGAAQAGNPHGSAQSLAWSPDGSKLAYRASTYGGFCGFFFSFPKECEAIATINSDGTGLTYLGFFDIYEAGGDW